MDEARMRNKTKAAEIAKLFTILVGKEKFQYTAPYTLDALGFVIKDLDEFVDNLKAKIKAYFTSLNHPCQDCESREMIMLAHVSYRKLINNSNTDIPADSLENDFRKIRKITVPFKNDPRGNELYREVTKQLALLYVREEQFGKAQELADCFQKNIEDYRKSGKPEPMSFYELINEEAPFQYIMKMDELDNEIAYLMWEAYEKSNKIDKLSDISVRAISYNSAFLQPNGHTLHSFLITMQVIVKFSYMLEVILLKRRYKQLDHAIASVMAYTVQYRRLLPEVKRPSMNSVQGGLANVFTKWGIDLLESLLQKLTGRGSPKPIDNETFEKVVFTGIELEGADIYAGQFQIQPIQSEEELKLVLSRAKRWNQRAVELSKNKNLGDSDLIKTITDEHFEKNYRQALDDQKRLKTLEVKLKNVDFKKL